jgi:Rieske Fe-S protein
LSEQSEGARGSRRRFIDGLLGIGLLGWMGSAVYPVVRYLKPLPLAGPGGPIRLSEEQRTTIDRERFIIVSQGSERVMVFKDVSEKLYAVDARCTHEGCTVQFLPGESMIWCACHNGRFDLDGRVISGPPPRPLPRYAVHFDEGGDVLVDAENA